MAAKVDITGKKYGKLKVIELAYRKGGKSYWKCLCSCGNTRIIQGYDITSGHTKSCGCIRKLDGKEPHFRHGDSKTRLYRIWSNMKDRCDNPNNHYFKDYGGRGITYCNEWKDYIAFKKWALSNGYQDELTIDRSNNNGNYEPANCRWITIKEQQRNRRSNHLLTYNGETHCINEWAEILGISRETIKNRLNCGWGIERIFTEPIHHKERRTVNE